MAAFHAQKVDQVVVFILALLLIQIIPQADLAVRHQAVDFLAQIILVLPVMLVHLELLALLEAPVLPVTLEELLQV